MLGLGGYPLVSLAETRDVAFAHRKQARTGGDPLTEKRHVQHMPTVEESVYRSQGTPTRRNSSGPPGRSRPCTWITGRSPRRCGSGGTDAGQGGTRLAGKTLRQPLRNHRIAAVVSRLPLVVPGLGGRGDRPSPRGHRSGAGARRPEPSRGGLCTLGRVRAPPPPDGRLGRLWTRPPFTRNQVLATKVIDMSPGVHRVLSCHTGRRHCTSDGISSCASG